MTRHRSKSLPNPQSTVVTTTEHLSDGTLLESIADPLNVGKFKLLIWKDKESRIADQFQYKSRTYVPVELDHDLRCAIRFPTRSSKFGTTRGLFEKTVECFDRHFNFAANHTALLAHFVFSSWFSDRLEIAPPLLISGRAHAEALEFLLLLRSLCRRPLLAAGISSAGFRSLPIQLRPTLLIHSPVSTIALQQLIHASSRPDLVVTGALLDLYCPKVIYSQEGFGSDFMEGILRLVITPGTLKSRRTETQSGVSLAEEFQAEFLAYRLTNYAKVRASDFAAPELPYPASALAGALGACVVDDAELAAGVIALLEQQRADLRAERCTDPECAILEALLALLHEGKSKEIYVQDIAIATNTILRTRGGITQFSPVEVGHKLKNMGLTRHRKESGMCLLLNDDTGRRVHTLGQRYDVMQNAMQGCPHCLHLERIEAK